MSYIGWPKLLPLALKLRSAQAVLGTGRSFAEFADDSDARAVLDTLEAVSNGQWGVAGRARRSDADADREGPAIDAYFTRVWKDLSAQTSHLARQDTLASQLLGGLEKQ